MPEMLAQLRGIGSPAPASWLCPHPSRASDAQLARCSRGILPSLRKVACVACLANAIIHRCCEWSAEQECDKKAKTIVLCFRSTPGLLSEPLCRVNGGTWNLYSQIAAWFHGEVTIQGFRCFMAATIQTRHQGPAFCCEGRKHEQIKKVHSAVLSKVWKRRAQGNKME